MVQSLCLAQRWLSKWPGGQFKTSVKQSSLAVGLGAGRLGTPGAMKGAAAGAAVVGHAMASCLQHQTLRAELRKVRIQVNLGLKRGFWRSNWASEVHG